MDTTSSDTLAVDHLVAVGKIQPTDVTRARLIAEERNVSLNSLLVRLGLVSDKDLAATLSELHGLSILADQDLPDVPPDIPALSTKFLTQVNILPIGLEAGRLTLGTTDPENVHVQKAVILATGATLDLKVGTASQIERALARLYGTNGGTELPGIDDSVHAAESTERLRDLASEAPIIRLVNQLISRAVESRASDIHIEPFEDRLDVRYRIDGVLQDLEPPPPHTSAAIISRIKLMAKLNIAERRLPQDGRIQIQSHGRPIDLRVSTVPTLHGESLVVRLLDKKQVVLDFTALGFSGVTQGQLGRLLDLPHGILLVTGPTGSGKTTTLYTALQRLNTRERKILTVEDPIEYQLAGINQIQVNPQIDLTFANALRSIVRQDPDVIMIGEMRDLETAAIAVQSALTGHLVLSTLHTNDAGSSVTRLLDMGVEDYLLSTTLNGILAQRLVRVLCSACRQPYRPTDRLVRELGLDTLSGGSEITLYRATGCSACSQTGYRGRQVIAELLVLTDSLRQTILSGADGVAIQQAAVAQGMATMRQDGLHKASEGVTTVEEVTRVTQDST